MGPGASSPLKCAVAVTVRGRRAGILAGAAERPKDMNNSYASALRCADHRRMRDPIFNDRDLLCASKIAKHR